MIRRQLIPALLMMVVFTVLFGFGYPLVVTAIAQIGFKSKADDSLITHGGKVVGSSLIGQNFLDPSGNPLPQYFQPRPSAAGTGYVGTASGASNLGPSNPLLVGNIPGVSISGSTNPYATPADPYCVPVQETDKNNEPVTDAQGNPVYQKNPDGSYLCNTNTVPERSIAYRQFNGLAANAPVPVDAVTASGSGLDPEISVANADLQAPRVAKARSLGLGQVMALVTANTDGRSLGFLGEKGVNVLQLNLALDRLKA